MTFKGDPLKRDLDHCWPKRKIQQETARDQQTKLYQIAHLQSHKFRRPVATIKGLINLLEMDSYHQSFSTLKVIRRGRDEIDERIAQIVSFTLRDV
jgi:sensor histidine kinase regulating citrate/malate metabolism